MLYTKSRIDRSPEWRELNLREGEQAVINGALITAAEDCRLFVNAKANVIAGCWPRLGASEAKAARDLYYATLGATSSDASLAQERQRLLDLLAETVSSCRTRQAQELCSSFAAGLLAGDTEAMLTSARKLAELEAGNAGRQAPESFAA